MPHSVSALYSVRVAAGEIEADTAQTNLIRRLDRLNAALADHRLARKSSALGWLFARRPRALVKGLYIHGSVGRGKTMLMDLFFEASPVRRKRRAHFDGFMTDVHARLHEARKDAPTGDAAVEAVADQIAGDAWLLAFDEFQVTDIADAMILGRLFEKLFSRGVVVVATSNVAPDDLYRDGLNRALFLPFIDLLKQRLDIMELDARTDFRLEKLSGQTVWHVPADDAARRALDGLFASLSAGASQAPARLAVQGRTLDVPQAAGGVARARFEDLCARPLGPADYLALAERFHTLVLDDIPLLPPEKRNEAKRFTTLIDALYDRGVKLAASAAALPDGLVSGGDQAFAFQRTVSRLTEMGSSDYLARPHARATTPRDSNTGGIVET